jgi:hypothetical protein
VAGTFHGDDIMSTKSAAIRKTRINTERLVEYLGVNESVTVSAIVRERLMNSRESSEALQYAIRHGVVAREKHPGAAPDERVTYRLTGQPLTAIKKPSFSFDALLSAWGLSVVRRNMKVLRLDEGSYSAPDV